MGAWKKRGETGEEHFIDLQKTVKQLVRACGSRPSFQNLKTIYGRETGENQRRAHDAKRGDRKRGVRRSFKRSTVIPE